MKLKFVPLCLLTAALIWALAGCGEGSEPPLLLAIEMAYWEETQPLIERAVLEGGTPLSEVYLGRYSGLLEGNVDDWEQYVAAVDIALPVYEGTLAKWLKIQPPSAGKAHELHTAYGLAWSKRVGQLSAISVGWRTGDEELLQDGVAGMDTASAFGRDAEALRVQFNTYLVEQCSIHRLPECS